MARKVTEEDFRMPEYRDAKVEDYEFRPDGKLVRKDRWEMAIQSIRCLVGISAREFEIPDVVAAVRAIVAENEGWIDVTDIDYVHAECPVIEVKLVDGSTLKHVYYDANQKHWVWNNSCVPKTIVAWREEVSKGEDK